MQEIRSVVLVLALWPICFPGSATRADDTTPHLAFDHKIGTDWKPDQNNWMSFVAIRSDGSTVAGDGNVPNAQPGGFGLWTFPGGTFLQSAAGRPLAISPDFRLVAIQDAVIEVKTGRQVIRSPRARQSYTRAAFSPDGQYLALVEEPDLHKAASGEITVLRVSDGATVARFSNRYVTAIAFGAGGRILASGHWNNVTLWDPQRGTKIAILFHGGPHTTGAGLPRDGRYIYGVGFSADGKMLAAGSDDGELQIWDVAARRLRHSINIGGGDVSTPVFSPNGKLLAAGTYGDGTVTLLSAASGRILSQVKVSMYGCGSVAFSPDGRFLVTPSNGGKIGPTRFDTGGTIRVFRVRN